MGKRKKRTFEVTRGQIFLALIVMAVALTAAYETGISAGKKRIIEAERMIIQKTDTPLGSTAPVPGTDNLPTTPPPDRVEPQNTMQKSDKQMRSASQMPIGGDLPIMPEEQTEDQPQVVAGSVYYTVQVGTFGAHQNAENLVAKLKSYEYKSWLRQESSSGRTLYSVLVGGFSTRDEAKQFGDSLRNNLSFVSSYMIREIQE